MFESAVGLWRDAAIKSRVNARPHLQYARLLIRRGETAEARRVLTVAARIASWSERWPATLGLVVGATYPEELAAVRRRCPRAPILLPGIGAQGGDLEASLHAGLDADGRGVIVSASRSVIYAKPQDHDDWTAAIRTSAAQLRDTINRFRNIQS